MREPLRGEPWFNEVRGNFTWAILSVKREDVHAFAKMFDWHTPFLLDPLATIAAVKPPQLRVLTEDDLEAPSAETSRRLAQLRLAGRSITTAPWARTEHGIFEYETSAEGERTTLRQPDGYLALLADFARGGALKPAYGNALLARPDWSSASVDAADEQHAFSQCRRFVRYRVGECLRLRPMIEPSARRWVMFALLVGVGMASSTAPSPTSRCPPLRRS